MRRFLASLGSSLGSTLRRLAMLVRGSRFDRDMEEEMRLHRELHERELIGTGATPVAARSAATRAFGNPLRLREKSREAWGWGWLDELRQDTRYGARALRRSPGFAAVAILTLAVGIGASTAIFGVVRAVLLRPLPFPEPDRLLVLNERTAQGNLLSVSYPNFLDWHREQHSFRELGLYRPTGLNLTGLGEAERVRGAMVSSELFPMLNWVPEVGRALATSDDLPGSPPVVVLSRALWQRRFGGDAGVVGTRVTLNGVARTVVGVLGAQAPFPADAQLWISLGAEVKEPEYLRRDNHLGCLVLGRLAPGVSLTAANDELNRIALDLAVRFPSSNTGLKVAAQPLLETLVGRYRSGLVLLSAAVGLMLLVVCANLANLLFARGAARAGELGVRHALGAGRLRILRQLTTESVLLALCGGGLGVLLAAAARRALAVLAPLEAGRFQETRIDLPVAAFAFGLALATAIFFGAWPAWRMARTGIHASIQSAGLRASAGRDTGWVRRVMIAGEVALTLTLLLADGLLWQSLARLRSVELGFDPSNLLMLGVDLAAYDKDEDVLRFEDRLLTAVRALPGVAAATLDSSPPLAADWQSHFDVDGLPSFAPGQGPKAEISVIEDDYFRVMRIPLRRGRAFGAEDKPGGTKTVIVDERLAARFWPGGDAIGKRLQFWSGTPYAAAYAIAGIVPSVRLYGFGVEPQFYQVYFPRSVFGIRYPTVLVRASGPPAPLVTAIRQLVRQLDPNQPVYGVRLLEDDLAASLRGQSSLVTLSTGFGAFALLLAAVGLYGVVAYAVGQRRRELGIRVALGAAPGRIRWLVLRESAGWGALGLMAGVAGGLLAGRLVASQLYGVGAADLRTFLAVPLLLAVVLVAAGLLPSRRATKVDLASALRPE